MNALINSVFVTDENNGHWITYWFNFKNVTVRCLMQRECLRNWTVYTVPWSMKGKTASLFIRGLLSVNLWRNSGETASAPRSRNLILPRLSCTVMEMWGRKYFGVTALTFWGHVTSSVTRPVDSPCGVSYRWSMLTMRLSCAVSEIHIRLRTSISQR